MENDKLDKLLKLTEENNQMLKNIIGYIQYKISMANNENMNDFSMNVLANIISNQLENKNKYGYIK